MRRRSLLKSGGVDYSKQYLTIVSLEDNNTIGWRKKESYETSKGIYVSTNDGKTWFSVVSNYNGNTIATLNNGDKLLVKYYTSDVYYNNYFTSTGYFDVEGNIMSLTTSGDFTTCTTLMNYGTFNGLFRNCTKLKSAKNLVLPATTLTESCYYDMFYNCTSLTTAPKLPATTLAGYCYCDMFFGCRSLVTAPVLPATTLAYSCYSSMFYGCSKLTTAPVLSATTLADYCYYNMFNGCTSLSSIKCLATNISASNCTYNWVSGVAASGTFTKAASMTGWTTGNKGIPSGWTTVNA